MRRPRTLVLATAAGGVVLAVWAGLALWTYAQRPQVTGSPQQWYRTSAPQVLVPVENAGNLSGRKATLDGKDASAKLRTTGDGLELELDNVADGAHQVRIQAQPSRVFGDTVDTKVHDPGRHAQAGAGGQPRAARLAPDHARSAGASSPARSWR